MCKDCREDPYYWLDESLFDIERYLAMAGNMNGRFYNTMSGSFTHISEQDAVSDAITKVKSDGRRRFIVKIIGVVEIEEKPIKHTRYE